MDKRVLIVLAFCAMCTACQATPNASTNQTPRSVCQHDAQCVQPWHPGSEHCVAQLRCVAGQCIQPAAETGVADNTTGILQFESNQGQQRLDVEIADDNFERARGMMCRTSMKKNWGMLFFMPTVRIQTFWMKNTLLSLDMVFIDEYWTIVGIVDNVPQQTLQTSHVNTPSKYVLELEAGQAARLGLFTGQVFRFSPPNE